MHGPICKRDRHAVACLTALLYTASITKNISTRRPRLLGKICLISLGCLSITRCTTELARTGLCLHPELQQLTSRAPLRADDSLTFMRFTVPDSTCRVSMTKAPSARVSSSAESVTQAQAASARSRSKPSALGAPVAAAGAASYTTETHQMCFIEPFRVQGHAGWVSHPAYTTPEQRLLAACKAPAILPTLHLGLWKLAVMVISALCMATAESCVCVCMSLCGRACVCRQACNKAMNLRSPKCYRPDTHRVDVGGILVRMSGGSH